MLVKRAVLLLDYGRLIFIKIFPDNFDPRFLIILLIYEIKPDKEEFFLRFLFLVQTYEKHQLINNTVFEVSRTATKSFEFGVVRNREIIKDKRFSM